MLEITLLPDLLTASKNDTWTQVHTDESNIIIRMEVYTAAPAVELMATITAPVSSAGKAMFNLKRILQGAGIMPDVLQCQLPQFDQDTITVASKNIKAYSLKFFTVDKASGLDVSTVGSTVLQVLLAGKSFINGNKNLLEILGTGSGQQRKFLTCHPQEKKLNATDQEFLFYYHSAEGLPAGSLTLKTTLYFNDNSTVIKSLLPFTPAAGTVSIIPAGYSQLDLAGFTPPGLKLLKYSLALALQADPSKELTQTFFYSIDERCFLRRRQFIFLNSLGGTDSLFAVDTQEAGLTVTGELAERILPYNYDTSQGQYYNFYKTGADNFKCTTDLLTLPERLYLAEFFMSTDIFEVTQAGFLPVILTESDYNLHKNRAELQNIQFAFRYGFDEVAYNNF